jgi:predicted nucleic acid-binding Zn ribbon protein
MLKIKRIPVYFYVCNEAGVTIQEVVEGVVQEDLLDFQMIIIHQD